LRSMPALQVLCKKESLDPERLEGRVVIVIDIFFATSTISHFNMEDFFGAGHLVSNFAALSARYELNDSAMAAMLFRQGCTAREALFGSQIGRLTRQR
jgi:hypothetical protein